MCSIGWPNYKLFYRFRRNDPNVKWIIIIHPSVLWEKDCAFCVSNAASNEVTCIPIAERKGLAAFEKLFEDIDGKPTRTELRIPDCCPTDPQAEILIFEIIEQQYIIGAFTEDKKTEIKLKKKYPDLDCLSKPKSFSYRPDYKYW